MAIYENNSKIYYVSRALRSTIELYCTDTAQFSGRHFIQISITISALKNCYMSSFLEVPSDILYHFWIQVADLHLKLPRGRFQK